MKKRRIKSNPVERALARVSLRKTVTRAQIQALMMNDGEDCCLLLVDYATIIGAACEAGAMVHNDVPWVRQLHQALKDIIDLCMGGYCWRQELALDLQEALALAEEHLFKLPNDELNIAYQSSRSLALRIEKRQIHGDEVLPELTAIQSGNMRDVVMI